MLKGQIRSSQYTLLVEDDMVWCNTASAPSNTAADVMRHPRNALELIFEAIDHSNTHDGSDGSGLGQWSGLRLGYGGNGLILPSTDLPAVSDYLLANMHRRPPDCLLPEWYKGQPLFFLSSILLLFNV